MKRMLIIFTAALIGSLTASAQPAKRRMTTVPSSGTTNTPAAKKTTTTTTEKKGDRAALMFPTSAEMPEDVVWRRDIYRQLNLLKDANAPLYYPVEPRGKDQNLFTYLLRLFVSGRIEAYKYNLDGNESFEVSNKVKPKDILENFGIYYEEKDGKINIAESDIPSAAVKQLYIKESSYFDQRSATYKKRVTALCPVMVEEDEFASIDDSASTAITKPMFWIKYDDVAIYLSRLPLMVSNFNNVTNMTADDYFTLNHYDGQIYMTNNLQGRAIPTDSTRTREQKRIEQQLKDFEENIWHAPKDSLDSLAVQQAADDKKSSRRSKKEASDSRRSKASAAAANNKREKSSGGSSSPRVSARRQRR